MKRFLILLTWLISGQASAVEVKSIDLFIKHGMEVKNERFARDITLNIHYIDDVEALQKQYSSQLSANPEEAKSQLKKLMSNPDFGRQFQMAYRSPLVAERLGINKVPAAVINGDGIIYGSADIAELLSFAQNKN